MELEEKKYWILFNIFEGIGPLRFKLLMDFFGTAKAAYNAPDKELLEIGLGEKLVRKFIEFRSSKFDIDSYLIRLDKLGISVLCVGEDNYPKMLKEIEGRPPLIYIKTSFVIPTKRTESECVEESLSSATVKGSLDFARDDKKNIFEKKAIAVVGSRKVTGYGRQVTEMIAQGLVDNGLVIVSGLARGVDEVAHKTAIDNKGITVGVLGCGLDLVYPPEHKILADEIVNSGGALVSEYPLNTPAMPGNFPARNRIISGLSLGVVVTEAAEDSGSLITASDAAEQGREVFAVPGPITSPLSKGTSELIKKGAKLVTGVEDILEELEMTNVGKVSKVSKVSKEELTDDERKIFDLLENESLHIDEIARKMDMECGKVGGTLSLLEIKGVIRSLGDGIYGLK